MRWRITLTGADEGVSLDDLRRLAERPRVEIGLLFSLGPARPRYPTPPWLQAAVSRLGPLCSLHLCGRTAREQVLGGHVAWAFGAGRIQINGQVTAVEVERARAISCYVVTQYGPRQEVDLSTLVQPCHQLLVDASGGRGISPGGWTRPETDKDVGFAGGLGAHNLATELPKLAAIGRGAWWVDMESSLRDRQDRFDLRAAHACVDIALDWLDDAGGAGDGYDPPPAGAPPPAGRCCMRTPDFITKPGASGEVGRGCE